MLVFGIYSSKQNLQYLMSSSYKGKQFGGSSGGSSSGGSGLHFERIAECQVSPKSVCVVSKMSGPTVEGIKFYINLQNSAEANKPFRTKGFSFSREQIPDIIRMLQNAYDATADDPEAAGQEKISKE